MASHKFLGIGNPLLDISSVVNNSLLERYGLKANDAILAEDKHKPLYAELMARPDVMYVAGGAAQNAMRGAQWLLPPQSTVYIGAVGRDSEAAQLKQAAAKDGLRTEYYEVESGVPTGRCGVLITDVHRCLVTDLLAANEYKISHLMQPEIWGLVENASHYYVGGYFLTVSPDSALHIAKHAAQHNKFFTMNLSAPFIPLFFGQHVDALAEYWDVVFGNEAEALAYAEAHKMETKSVVEVAKHIAALPKSNNARSRLVVFTQGAHPTITVQDGLVKEFPVIPIDVAKIVDTNGAGDAFCGGFMSQYVQGKPLEACIAAGNYVANVVIQRSGPTYPDTPHQFCFSA